MTAPDKFQRSPFCKNTYKMSRIKLKNGKLYFWPRRGFSGVALTFLVFSFPLLFINIINDQTATTVIVLLFLIGLFFSLLLIEPANFDNANNAYRLHFWSSHPISDIRSVDVTETYAMTEQTSQYDSNFILKVVAGSKEINLGYYSSKEMATQDCEVLKAYIQNS